LIGYDPQPAGMQMVFYAVVALVIGAGMVAVGRQQPSAVSKPPRPVGT
jgi:hypothetical protein